MSAATQDPITCTGDEEQAELNTYSCVFSSKNNSVRKECAGTHQRVKEAQGKKHGKNIQLISGSLKSIAGKIQELVIEHVVYKGNHQEN